MKVIIGLKYFSIKVVIFFFHTEFDEFQVSIFKKISTLPSFTSCSLENLSFEINKKINKQTKETPEVTPNFCFVFIPPLIAQSVPNHAKQAEFYPPTVKSVGILLK